MGMLDIGLIVFLVVVVVGSAIGVYKALKEDDE
jgi:hypothetical protein